MDKQEVLHKIQTAFENILEHNSFQLEEHTSAKDVDGWDSITHMMIITEIEEMYQIKFKLMDLMGMNTIADLIRTVEKEVEQDQTK
jgi:acyl carrier protein